jgi:hypothetical protein
LRRDLHAAGYAAAAFHYFHHADRFTMAVVADSLDKATLQVAFFRS